MLRLPERRCASLQDERCPYCGRRTQALPSGKRRMRPFCSKWAISRGPAKWTLLPRTSPRTVLRLGGVSGGAD